jgi:hypothetical protein
MALVIGANGNIQLQSDQVTFIHLAAFDAAKGMVPIPAGDVDTVASGGTFAASLAFAITVMPAGDPLAGQPAVSCTPLVLQSNAANAGGGITMVITDTAVPPLTQTPTLLFDIVPDVAAVQVGLDTTDSTTVAQTAPTAAGP